MRPRAAVRDGIGWSAPIGFARSPYFVRFGFGRPRFGGGVDPAARVGNVRPRSRWGSSAQNVEFLSGLAGALQLPREPANRARLRVAIRGTLVSACCEDRT